MYYHAIACEYQCIHQAVLNIPLHIALVVNQKLLIHTSFV